MWVTESCTDYNKINFYEQFVINYFKKIKAAKILFNLLQQVSLWK